MNSLADQLKLHGFSATKARQHVFDAFLKHGSLTMGELVKQTTGTVDRASVYRSVALFERLGFIRRIPMGWKYKLELSDTFTEHHHHLTCRKCSKVIDLHDDAKLDQQITKLVSRFGFTDLNHELEISGLCQDCTAK